jgi:hypothetical protein
MYIQDPSGIYLYSQDSGVQTKGEIFHLVVNEVMGH